MHRYTFVLSKPFVDANSGEEALKIALAEKILVLQQGVIPTKARIECFVSPTPNPNNQYTAQAIHQGELLASVDAPSPERALRALGFNNPAAHTCNIYKKRFGDFYEMVMGTAAKKAL